MPFDGTNFEPEIVQMLRTARGLIEGGWTRGRLKNRKRYCLVGAYRRAFEIHCGLNPSVIFMEGHPADRILCNAVLSGLHPSAPPGGCIISGFTTGRLAAYNDCVERTKAEVLAVYDRAIAQAIRSHDKDATITSGDLLNAV